MSRAESFLRGGTPCTEVPELIDMLSTAHQPYTHWRFVAYYPQRWYHDAVENRLTAPLDFLIFACTDIAATMPSQTDSEATQGNAEPPCSVDCDAWHLLCHTVLPSGAIPIESRVDDGAIGGFDGTGNDDAGAGRVTTGGGGVGALRTLLHTLPTYLQPSASLEWFSVVDGEAYARMGLISDDVFTNTLVPSLAEVLGKSWRGGLDHLAEASAEAAAKEVTAGAHYVHNSRCIQTADFRRAGASAAVLSVRRADPAAVQPFVDAVVRAAARWMADRACMRAFTDDASVPALPDDARSVLYPVVAHLPPCLYTSFFVEAAHALGETFSAPAVVDPETLTGLAKLRAERDAGIAQWKRKTGEYASFTVDGVVPAATSTHRAFQHAILLQRPIEAKRRIDVDNRDPGPLAPQPIAAELHLLQDRGDVQYTLGQLGNRSNIHFLYSDTLPDDGEVLVQMAPVEGTPFCDLEAYFQSVPSDAPVFTSAPASWCAGSCCAAVVPRVVFRRPTGKAHKANPIATAQAEVEVLPPTGAMVAAAVAALQFLGDHAERLHDGASASLTSPRVSAPTPGYTVRVPPVDLTLVPPKKCGWCGRQREVLLRCGGCKAVLYCSKRHQALDWKEGSHKVECKLWRRARELHERVVEQWASRTPSTWGAAALNGESTVCERKGPGWSYAATLVQFIKDVEATSAAQGSSSSSPCASDGRVLSIHVAGFDTSYLDVFLRACGQQLCTFNNHTRQYRILLCADTFTDAERNAVWAVRRCSDGAPEPAWRTRSTGVLGDAWHCEGDSAEATAPPTCVALLRCCGVKYHNVDRGSSSSSSTAGRGERPSAVLSFGPVNGEGCTFLTAALEVFAGQDVGVVPLRLVDSSYVGAVRTRDALAARIGSSDVCSPTTKAQVSRFVLRAREAESAKVAEASMEAYTASGGQRQPFHILFNDSGAVASEATLTASVPRSEDGVADVASADVHEESAVRAGSAVPHYVNSYVFDVYPSDFHW